MMTQTFSMLFRPFLRDRFLHILLLLGVILTVFQPEKASQFISFVDWNTIVTLLGLLMLTKGVELSGYFDVVGRKMINTLDNERWLALFLVTAAAVLSTITLKKLTSLPVTRLIVFEALAVNAGSLLTPVGNPQNILLWNRSGQSFLHFIAQMTPLALVTMAALLIVTWISFPSHSLKKKESQSQSTFSKPLLISCVVLYLLFIACVDLGFARYGLVAVLVGFLVMSRQVLLRIDWPLILVFITMFVDVRLIVGLGALQQALGSIAGLPDYGHYLLGLGLSQVISNVPATILLVNYVPANALLAYAVNAGGFGLVIGSLANLIALRMSGEKKIWITFHYYSFAFLAFSGLVGWWLLPLVA
jgi:Na+/H+ antiporter NhaD/arsenite permease-like protein